MPKKKKNEEIQILSIVPAPGDWVAVLDGDERGKEECGLDVAAWALTEQGVMGLVSSHGSASLVLVPDDCVGYTLSLGLEAWDAASKYIDAQAEKNDDEDDDEDDDPDES